MIAWLLIALCIVVGMNSCLLFCWFLYCLVCRFPVCLTCVGLGLGGLIVLWIGWYAYLVLLLIWFTACWLCAVACLAVDWVLIVLVSFLTFI